MADLIEHIQERATLQVVPHFVCSGSSVIVASPYDFLDKYFRESEDEHHVSHWSHKDFGWCHRDWQVSDAGVVYTLSKKPISI